MVDTFVQMVNIAVHADPGTMFGTMVPAVRIHVTQDALESGRGAAYLEGQGEPVSVATARRNACAGIQPFTFDPSGRVNLAREQRLFTAKQRRALGARDGGCLFPGCDRPPGWCEAHHNDEWVRDHGRTDVDRGVLLCRHHHRWVHTHPDTRVIWRDRTYGLHDPRTDTFTPWPSKHPLHQRRPFDTALRSYSRTGE